MIALQIEAGQKLAERIYGLAARTRAKWDQEMLNAAEMLYK